MGDNYEINDIRSSSEFKGITFSGYKKSDVKTQLINNLKKNKIEQSCYWSGELICAGHYLDLWEYLLFYFGKHIHLGNPKIISYLQKRFEVFKNVMHQGQFVNELQIRNHPTIRQIFAEIVCVLIQSDKKNSTEIIKVIREEDYIITQLNDKLKATSMDFAKDIFRSEDPKELFIAINEFCYNISSKKSMIDACYWYEWIVDFNTICKKNKDMCVCEMRTFVNVENKFRKDCVWMLWDALLHYSSDNKFVHSIMQSTLNMFSIKYTTATCKKRRYLFYFAISLLTEKVITNSEIIKDKKTVEAVTSKINIIYKQIKKNEHSPNTEYLFANIEKENALEKSLAKMSLVNSIDIAK
jgi:hypothetical protein